MNTNEKTAQIIAELEQARTQVANREHDLLEFQNRLETVTDALETARTTRDFDQLENLESSRSAVARLTGEAEESLGLARNQVLRLEQALVELEHQEEIALKSQIEKDAASAYRTAFSEIIKTVEDSVPSLQALMTEWQAAAHQLQTARNVTSFPNTPHPTREANGKGEFANAIAQAVSTRMSRLEQRRGEGAREEQRQRAQEADAQRALEHQKRVLESLEAEHTDLTEQVKLERSRGRTTLELESRIDRVNIQIRQIKAEIGTPA